MSRSVLFGPLVECKSTSHLALALSFASPKGPPLLPVAWDHLAPTFAGW